MPVELLLPGHRRTTPKMPSRIALAMAFGVGNPTILGDKSRYRSHGTITRAVPAAGLHGYCLDFAPPLPNYVTVPAAHTQLDFTSEAFSIIARINVDSLTVYRAIIERRVAAVGGYILFVDSTGYLAFYTYQVAVSQNSRSSAGDIATGTWYTVGLSRNGASVRLYRNGIDVTSVVGVHVNPISNAGNFMIGVRSDLGTAPFDGRIEFLRIFRGIALATSEHLAWHNALA